MLTVLFWNIQKKPLLHRVARIATSQVVDVVLLTECEQTDADLLAALNGVGKGPFRCPTRRNDRFRVACRFPASVFGERYTDASRRLSVYELKTQPAEPLLLGLVHLVSPAQWEDRVHRNGAAAEVAGALRQFESKRGHARTVVVGDFNLNPFDDGLIGVHGFHSLMTRGLARQRDRRLLQGTERPSFFNPMWQFMTDRSPHPSGTVYFEEARPTNPYWHTPDQVLVRPALVDRLVEVQVLETDGIVSLLDASSGRPDDTNGSDHLPLLFRLDW
jgi:endonuclease/exonuclease/phosphatase family metal-dependent hydrolase